MEVILYWNDVALEVHRRDFSAPNQTSADGPLGKREVGGPTRVSRALAIVHAAIYNAQEAVAPRPGGPQPYLRAGLAAPGAVPAGASPAGAVAGAAVAALKMLWPSQTAYIDRRMREFFDAQLALPAPPTPASLSDGADYGETIGLAIFNYRAHDGHDRPDENVYMNAPCRHRADPMQPGQPRLSTHWGRLPPFLIPVGGAGIVSHAAYLAPPPPCGSPRYAAAVADVQQLGKAYSLYPAGTGERSPEQTVIGIFWGYDGSTELGVPPRLYNQVVRSFVKAQATAGTVLNDAEAAHLFALVNFAMADAAIVAWGAKYHYDLWRPVVGIREDASGYGPNHGSAGLHPPSGAAMPATADPGWLPLGIPRTNSPEDLYKTPDFPAYPSGHATFGAAAFRTTALFYANKTSRSAAKFMADEFSFISDEYNGKNVDPRGDTRPALTQTLTLGSAIVDNAVSRVYLGVHWRFDGLGTEAPDGLEGARLPTDPAGPHAGADEKRLGGVAAGLEIAKQVVAALP